MVQTSFNFCTAAFIFMMSCGFLTFGGASQGLILNNYAELVGRFLIIGDPGAGHRSAH